MTNSTDDTGHSPTLTGLLGGFRAYRRPQADEWQSAYTAGLIVLDTNSILDLYRFSPRARKDYLEILRKVSGRLFVPHRVALEFHRRRVEAVSSHRATLTSTLNDVSTHSRNLREAMNRLSRNGADPDELQRTVAAVEPIESFAKSVVEEYDLDHAKIADGDDPLLKQLARILDGRIGIPPSPEFLKDDIKEGERRTKEKIPPGFKDEKKEEGVNGDYLWWAEVLRNPTNHAGPVLIVTNEEKPDWILRQSGQRIGPRPELYEELLEKTGNELLITTVRDLLKYAPEHLDIEKVSDSTIAEATELVYHRSGLPDRRITQLCRTDAAAKYLALPENAFNNVASACSAHRVPQGYISFLDLVRVCVAVDLAGHGTNVTAAGAALRGISDDLLPELTVIYGTEGNFGFRKDSPLSLDDDPYEESSPIAEIIRATTAFWDSQDHYYVSYTTRDTGEVLIETMRE